MMKMWKEFDLEQKWFFSMWIITLIIVLFIWFFHSTPITINNYISSGNYTFDVGDNFVKLYDLSK